MGYNSLSELFKATADAIRSKSGSTDLIVANDFPTAIESISTGDLSGEPIGYVYGLHLPDINTVWTDEVKKILPYAFIATNNAGICLYMTAQPICLQWGEYRFKEDTIGICADLLINSITNTNRWDDYFLESVPNWTTADDIGEYVGWAGDKFSEDGNKHLVWSSVDIPNETYPGEYYSGFDFADPVTVYKGGIGVEGGGSGGNNENILSDGGVLSFDGDIVYDHDNTYITSYFKLCDDAIDLGRVTEVYVDLWRTQRPGIAEEELEAWRTTPCGLDGVRTTQTGCDELWMEIPPGYGEWRPALIRVTADDAVVGGVTLSKGVYWHNIISYPTRIVVAPMEK